MVTTILCPDTEHFYINEINLLFNILIIVLHFFPSQSTKLEEGYIFKPSLQDISLKRWEIDKKNCRPFIKATWNSATDFYVQNDLKTVLQNGYLVCWVD